MLRTHTCGELRSANAGNQVTLCGWVQKVRDKGGMVWVDLRDRYGVTQLIFEEGVTDSAVLTKAKTLGREFVLQVTGEVVERYAKNDNMPTGNIEIKVAALEILNASKVPPFIIDNDTDGGEEVRMKYRYLDLRRNEVRDKLMLRHKMLQATRKYLSDSDFMEVETPVLIKSTPEGARDFVVPSRVNKGEFYALPQSPQTFKQLLMVSGFDRYFQIVKCFRDEDLRADRQPEFTQIDCEMSFVTQEDILNTFEGLTRFLFKEALGVEVGEFVHMQYDDAMRLYGSDKPDVRFGMQFVELNDVAQNKGFSVFDDAELVVGICAEGCGEWTRKQLDALTDYVKRPQVGAKGLVHVKCNEDGTFKSSVDKFFSQEDLKLWADKAGAKSGDLLLVMSGTVNAARKQMNDLRLHMGDLLELKDPMNFKPLWVLDFPLLEWDEDSKRYHAMHHPFTSPKLDQIPMLDTDPGAVKANAYDLVINGVEIGGGSIRIHDKQTQALMFKHLGFSDAEAKAQFGFLMEAFEYGAPPHGGIAFGFDRLCSMFGGSDSIRDFIAFPKNTSARDVMIESPSPIAQEQLEELGLKVVPSL
ncbi:aspartate--tRNA ligase [Reichenbachiella agarivorans]|uniref:Aspartate--tRNA ligase n=1 Tax=Reichenbachiella agarivorans TaxID=2979464 RepID=A0ABY6CPV8_9BACT|nr:aspartate--tRNA ligase [Reichenbachiella agarivorans]UXP32559.1 aspartate--tRNA ligase [Reichenbachiella agarivorans]